MKNIHIIAPASSAKEKHKKGFSIGEKNLEKIGYNVTYGDHIFDTQFMERSGSIENRMIDWNNVWNQNNTDYILSFTGGTNSNQILDYIDWELVKNCNKTLIGYSDITVLANAIYTKTQKISFLGVNYSYLCRESVMEYTLNNLQKALGNNEYIILPSNKVNINMWETPPIITDSEGWWTLQGGSMNGKVIGGNLPSFRLLYGTEYMPDLSKTIVFIEWDNFTTGDIGEFDRELEALTMQKGFDTVQGIVIGRFQEGSNISKDNLIEIIKNKKKLNNLPILANVDFGHTAPMFVFPIGGNAEIDSNQNKIKFSY
jgi:muramoyltetrapeptide carboxypeptidase LdcA involved in peptidoglycan recycling